jgi:hypothetical protein
MAVREIGLRASKAADCFLLADQREEDGMVITAKDPTTLSNYRRSEHVAR